MGTGIFEPFKNFEGLCFIDDSLNDSAYIPWDLIIGDDYDVRPTKELNKIFKTIPCSKHETKLNNFWNKYCSNR